MRVGRSLAAGEAKLEVADAAAASELLAAAELGPVDELQRARLERLRAQIAFTSRRGSDAPPLLLEAARRLEPLDAALARETYLEAIASAMFAGRLGSGADERDIAEAARESNRPPVQGAADRLLDALVTRFTEGYVASVAPLSRALRAFGEPDGGGEDRRWLWLACRFAQDLWDDELWHVLATRGVRLGRETGALNLLPNALNHLAAFNVHSGAFTTAAAQIAEVDAIAQATGLPPLKYAAGKLAAARGDQAQLQAMLEREMPGAIARGEGAAAGARWYFTAVLDIGHGRYGEALADARQACEREDVVIYGWALAELIEAGVRGGGPDESAAALERLSERTQASGTEWALGIEARCRALLSDDEFLYHESIERLARSRAVVELARSRLLYGEWLRRENRRTDAREQLRASSTSAPARSFAPRSRARPMRPSSALPSRERSQLPDHERGEQRGDDEAEPEDAQVAAERHEQREQRGDRHALGVHRPGRP